MLALKLEILLYGSGFPKSMNIGLMLDKKNGVESKVVGTGRCGKNRLMGGLRNEEHPTSFEIKQAQNKWAGWGTCLKPAFEPIIVARKPVENSVLENVEKYGVGGINIDECRVGNEHFEIRDGEYDNNENQRCFGNVKRPPKEYDGRFPANVILTYDETDFDEVCGGMPETKSAQTEEDNRINQGNSMFIDGKHNPENSYNDNGNACRYFYCAKASKKDRDSGLIRYEEKTGVDITGRKENSNGLTWDGGEYPYGNAFAGAGSPKKNIHPTVKPVELMQYLVRLVTPKGGFVLDIFNGSGSTGKAVAFENRERDADYKYIGIELDPEYCEISKSRIDYAVNKFEYDLIEEIEENEKKGQLSLFDFEEENNEIQGNDNSTTD